MNNDQRDILSFFLNIYRIQLGGKAQKTNVIPLSSSNRTADAIYELRIMFHDNWRSRRISIAPLAEDSGSKSRCYKIIYDDNIVIKMPPSPPASFSRYLDHLDQERHNASHLRPTLECITPTASAIIGKIPPFSDNNTLPPDEFEEKCIQMLKRLPHFQDYLRIGGKFAFFMNLSRYSFLSQVIKDMHQSREQMQQEMVRNVETLDDIVPFESRYGKDKGHIYFDISDAYNTFEERLKPVLSDCQFETHISGYQKREWFLSFISKNNIDENDRFECPGNITEINRILEETCNEHVEAVRAYRNMIVTYAFVQSFERNRSAKSGVITNLMGLLATLREKGIAMRDLKPDNAFIAGDVGSAPDFLAQTDAYSIGLIDFETAIRVDLSHSGHTDQPMLCGTPSYATPSHLFRNIVLNRVLFKDLAKVLHIQDWQAITAMIYSIVIGRRLFEKASRLYPNIIKIIKKTHKNKDYSQEKLFKVCSRSFWQGTRAELEEKVESQRRFLSTVKPLIPNNARKMLLEELHFLRTDIDKKLQAAVLSQNIFKDEKSRRGLIKAEVGDIRNYIENWESGKGRGAISENAKAVVIRFLKRVEALKDDIRRHSARMARLETQNPRFPCDELILLMNDVTINTMYQDEWADETTDIKVSGDTPIGDAAGIRRGEIREVEKTMSMMLQQ